MNMKDIAGKAGVSISTVSKVLNNKAGDISESTRKKVLDIIREHNYKPYGMKNGFKNKTNILAVIIPSISKNYFARILESIEKEAAGNGYSIAVFFSQFNERNEQKLIRIVESKDFDGLIFVTSSKSDTTKFRKCSKPTVVIGNTYENFPSFFFDYSKISEKAVSKLIDHQHKNIGCIMEFNYEEFLKGAELAIAQAGLSANNLFHSRIVTDSDIENNIKRFTSLGVTAFFCSSIKIVSQIYKFAAKRYWEIPKDFSLIAFEDEIAPDIFFPPISTVGISLEDTAAASTKSLIDQIDENKSIPNLNEGEIFFNKTGSISSPIFNKEKNIVVIGSLNMDTILSVTHLPQAGETLMVRSKSSMPGGKGANQAVGVGKLNGQVSIIGRLGNDSKGREIYRNLIDNRVNVEGIIFDNKNTTGSAYIIFDENGNNIITVHGGANDWFDPKHLEKAKNIIANSSYALIQTEIPIETVKTAIKMCHGNGVRILLKPSPAVELPDEYFKGLFLLIPNEMESKRLCPAGYSIEDQAEYFISKGIANVIITLGEKGAYYSNGTNKNCYGAFNFNAIDTTGASDAFISALAVYISEGNTIEASIGFASYAAGLSVTKEGVQTSLPFREELADYEKNPG